MEGITLAKLVYYCNYLFTVLFCYSLHRINNECRINGSVYWQKDKHVSFDVFGDYNYTDARFKCDFKTSVQSTIKDISSITATFQHFHDADHMDTDLFLTVRYQIGEIEAHQTFRTFLLTMYHFTIEIVSNKCVF